MSGHIRVHAAVSAALGLLLLTGIVQVAVLHAPFTRAHPFNLVWIGLALALGVAVFLPNRTRVRLTNDVAPFLGYGALACLAGFAVQGVLNPAITKAFEPGPLGLVAYLFLGLGAALSQTSGKWAAVAFLHRVRRPADARQSMALGLAVGLGFALTEIVVIGQRTIVQQTALVAPATVSLLERASAAGFHVYSGGLIAVAVAQRRPAWLLVVLLLHTALDWLAGAAGAHRFALPLALVEAVFLVTAVVTWLLYQRARTGLAAWMAPGGVGP